MSGALRSSLKISLPVSEDQAAVAMLTEPLSGRRDLVEGLDAEAIFDYLTQHGVLDGDTLQVLRSTSIVTQRNAALLQHVEKEGHNAVALFINALRQSGQLHLASSLDNTERIKPMSEGGKCSFLPPDLLFFLLFFLLHHCEPLNLPIQCGSPAYHPLPSN